MHLCVLVLCVYIQTNLEISVQDPSVRLRPLSSAGRRDTCEYNCRYLICTCAVHVHTGGRFKNGSTLTIKQLYVSVLKVIYNRIRVQMDDQDCWSGVKLVGDL